MFFGVQRKIINADIFFVISTILNVHPHDAILYPMTSIFTAMGY